MRDTPTKVFGLMCALVGVWVVVYWFYEPAKPPVTFDSRRTGSEAAGIRPDPLAQLDNSPSSPTSDESKPKTLPERRETATPGNNTSSTPTNDTASRTPKESSKPRDAATPTGPRAVAPKFKDYTVERGDTFEVIARKMLGDAKHWKAIAEANAFVDPRKLVPGRTVLRIPIDPANVQGVVLSGAPVPTGEQSAPLKPAPKAESHDTASGAVEYVIKSSDTLSGIAKEFLGKSSAWREIYEANKDVIDDPDHLKPGTTIRIPKS